MEYSREDSHEKISQNIWNKFHFGATENQATSRFVWQNQGTEISGHLKKSKWGWKREKCNGALKFLVVYFYEKQWG